MANWWDKNLTDKQKFRLQEPKDPSLLDVVSTVPNPVGDVASGLLAAQDVSKGNYGTAALNSLGLLPFIPSMGAMLKDVGKAPLSELEQHIKSYGGDFGLQRFYKAKSLVPDLEEQFSEKALKDMFSSSDAKGLTVMKPSQYEDYASRLSGVENNQKYSKWSLDDKDYLPYSEYMSKLKNDIVENKLEYAPYLGVENKTNFSHPQIVEHEGRHRTRALSELGDNPTIVQIRATGELEKSLPKVRSFNETNGQYELNPNFFEALNKQTNDYIYPQSVITGSVGNWKEIPRIRTKLPNEIFGAALIPTAGLLDTKEKKKEKNKNK